MRILGHIHTYNDDDVIDRSLSALINQTYPLEEILIVDNASTDKTLSRVFPKQVTLVRHATNLGTSGSVITGFKYALQKGFEWIWVFDADSAPHGDALERLVRLYQSFSLGLQAQTRVLSSLPVDSTSRRPYHAGVFTPMGIRQAPFQFEKDYYEFEETMWTGCLFKLDSVRKIGLPSADYVLDWGECEYSYRGMRTGQKAFMHQGSIVEHNIGGHTSLTLNTHYLGPIRFKTAEFPPIRCYYLVRNCAYFWLYEYQGLHPKALVIGFLALTLFTLNFIVRPRKHLCHIVACLRGIWDGLRQQVQYRY
jgi:rhamnosyltransferase